MLSIAYYQKVFKYVVYITIWQCPWFRVMTPGQGLYYSEILLIMIYNNKDLKISKNYNSEDLSQFC